MVGIQAEVRRLINESISSGLFPGAAWLVERGGEVKARGAAGSAETRPVRRAMTEETIFDLASLTKPIVTGTLSLLMWQRGCLSMAEGVGAHLPEFTGGWRDSVSLAQVLSHSSGLPSGLNLSELCADPSEVLNAICRAKNQYPPGTSTLYSDIGFILMGKLLEGASGMALDAMAKEEIFNPLGMKRTMYTPPPDLRGEIAATQDSPARGRVLVGEVHDGNAYFMGGISGHAGLFSCLDDLAAYCRMMLGRGRRILSQDTVSEATRIWADDGRNAYGLSWFKRKSPVNPAGSRLSDGAYGHTGYTGTSLWIDPASEFFALLLTNRIHPDRAPERIPEMNRTRRAFHDIAVGSIEP